MMRNESNQLSLVIPYTFNGNLHSYWNLKWETIIHRRRICSFTFFSLSRSCKIEEALERIYSVFKSKNGSHTLLVGFDPFYYSVIPWIISKWSKFKPRQAPSPHTYGWKLSKDERSCYIIDKRGRSDEDIFLFSRCWAACLLLCICNLLNFIYNFEQIFGMNTKVECKLLFLALLSLLLHISSNIFQLKLNIFSSL